MYGCVCCKDETHCSSYQTMRMYPKRLLKSAFIFTASVFLLLHMRAVLVSDGEQDTAHWDAESREHQSRLNIARYSPASSNSSVHLSPPDRHALHGGRGTLTENAPLIEVVSADNRTALREAILHANVAERILNLNRFELSATVVIVVQVHDRADYLRHLIDSLRNARDICNALLIFSHDHYDQTINNMVAAINFTLVMQIFYPNSIQIYPDQFPGTDPADCSRDVKRADAEARGCANAAFPDKYGHYREANYAQTKHHWFWKMNHVFDGVRVMKTYNGPVLLLEDDHYVTEDFIPVLLQMYRFKQQACTDCSIFSLGSYSKKPTYAGSISQQVDIMNWLSTHHNMGMSLDRPVWQSIRACAQKFCSYDDYNWDWSLQHISMTCIANKLRVMAVKAPRVYHIGECGVHHKGKNCDPKDRVSQIESLLSVSRSSLFPAQLSVAGYPRTPTRLPKQNGGWGDHRDHALCLSFLHPHHTPGANDLR